MPRRQQNLATLRSEVFAPTFSAKTIYVYNSPDAGHDGLLKIGDASVKGLHSLDGVMPNAPELDAAAKKRIDSYTRTQGASYNLVRTELAVRKALASVAPIITRLEIAERRQILDQQRNEERFDTIFKAMDGGDFPPQKVFFEGKHYDAYSFAKKLVRKAAKSIVLVDAYVGVAMVA